jgi:hypothetical protein
MNITDDLIEDAKAENLWLVAKWSPSEQGVSMELMSDGTIKLEKSGHVIATTADAVFFQRQRERQAVSSGFDEFIEGMTVSVDISTGKHDIGNRLFGTVSEVMHYSGGGDKNGLVLLVQDVEINLPELDSAGFLLTYKNGTTEFITRAPDNFEIRECKIQPLYAAPSPELISPHPIVEETPALAYLKAWLQDVHDIEVKTQFEHTLIDDLYDRIQALQATKG